MHVQSLHRSQKNESDDQITEMTSLQTEQLLYVLHFYSVIEQKARIVKLQLKDEALTELSQSDVLNLLSDRL